VNYLSITFLIFLISEFLWFTF